MGAYCPCGPAGRLPLAMFHAAGAGSLIRQRNRLFFVVLLAAVLLLPGCAVFGPKLQAPQLAIAGVELVQGDLFEQRLRVRMKVQNPNERELRVRGITYTIELGGEQLGRGLSGSSFVVPARGEAEFDMLVTANLAGTVLKLVERARKAGSTPRTLEYRLRGEVKLERGLLRTVPFDEKGTLPLR